MCENLLQGLVMELKDGGFPLIAEIRPTVNVAEAFD
jgi:hypothetical protein